jgi:succinyl-diaminopimelate desuccinylase
MDDLVSKLEWLVGIPSPTGEEDHLLEALAGFLDRRCPGATLHRSRDGLLAEVAGEEPLVLLAGHVDTVPPQGPVGPRNDGERIWGLGTSDMKSGLAVILQILEEAQAGGSGRRIVAVFYKGEEGSYEENSLGRLLEAFPEARAAGLAILLEPTDNEAEVGCLGTVNVEVEVPGRACHSARPWLGRSAVAEAAGWILEAAQRSPWERRVQGLVFKETEVITLLQAGTARNVVPGSLRANVNIRYAPDRELEEVLEAFRRRVPEAWSVRVVDQAPPGRVVLDAPLVGAFLEVLGKPPRAKQAWTDVARFTALGVPALNFGPGDPELAHRPDEHVLARRLEEAHGLLARFLRLGHPSA